MRTVEKHVLLERMADGKAAPAAAGGVDVFKLVADKVADQESKAMQDTSAGVECELLFVGAKNSGKSTLIHSFLMKEDTPKPTTALEYRFARRSTGDDKAVANIWELGGGSQLSELLKVVLLPERLTSCVVAITLDLSNPGDALSTLTFWLDEVRKQVETCAMQLRATPAGAASADKAQQLADELWLEHPDGPQVRPVGVPVVVLGHKWDEFEANFGEPENRKVLTRCLRYFCHVNGASLVCTKHKDKAMMTVLRNLLYHHVFHTSAVRTVQLEHTRPLVVPASADSIAAIGKPPLVEGVHIDTPSERWRAAFEASFPPKAAKREAQDLSLVEAEQFAEEIIDVLRRQKQGELDKMRREATREQEQAARTGAAGLPP